MAELVLTADVSNQAG